MEIVSSKLEMKGLVASTRVEQKDTSPRRWNAGTTATSHSTGAASASTASRSSSTRKREALIPGSGKSLLSLKAYFRKLRVFKGTVKALINLRRFPVLTKAATGIGADAADQKQGRLSQRRPTAMVARISTDDDALQAVQLQVKSLAEEGVNGTARHVITEIDLEQGDEVTYRLQGDLEHYTEGNLRKRAALETHPHMIALTQRLWLSAVQDDEENLSFPEYEAFMLRLHRLILPEFDLNGSKELIHDDWNRDANGANHLDYRFFHLSMFELVDLWTDTVDPEDVRLLIERIVLLTLLPRNPRYSFLTFARVALCVKYISLLYCIMHSLTFVWNAKYILKPLEDICPVDILEESKAVSMDEIARDLEAEVNSEAAQLYRGRLKLPEVHQGDGGDDSNTSGSGEKMLPLSGGEVTGVDETSIVLSEATSSRGEGGLIGLGPATRTKEPQVPLLPLPAESEETRSSTEATQRDPKRPRSPDVAIRKKSASRANSSTLENDRKLKRLASTISRQQKNLGIESAALKTSVVFDPFTDFHANSNSSEAGGSGHLNVQGRQNFQGNAGSLKRGSASNPFGSNNGVVLSIGTTDGSDFVNMVSRPSFVVKPSAIVSTLNRSSAGADINWRDFYHDVSGGSETNSSEFGVSTQEVLRGNKFDFGRIEKQTQPNGSLSPSPRKSTSGASGGSISTSEYLRINQAYAGAQLEKREQQLLNSALKVNEQRDGVSTLGDSIAGSNPSFSVISTPISPRSRSATYKRPSSQSHRTSTFGTAAQYDYTQQLEMNGTRVSDSRSGTRPGSLSVNATSSPSNNNHFADHIGTPPHQYQQQQLSPRSHRIHSQQQQQQQSRTSSSPLQLADGLRSLTITSAQPLTSSSIPGSSSSSSAATVRWSPRRSADGASLVILSSSIASAVPDQGHSANPFSAPSPRPGLGLTSLHSNVTAVSVVPSARQRPSPRKMSNHHTHQGSASSRRSMLADGSKRIQQQQFGVGLGQISVQSVPISPRKQ